MLRIYATAVAAVLASFLLLSSCTRALLTDGAAGKGRIVERTLSADGGKNTCFVYLPPAAGSDTRHPVLLYLHGNGEGGAFRDIAGHLGTALKAHPERFPAIIVFPRCPRFNFWIGPMTRFAVEAMKQSVKEFNGDPDRLLVSGVSMGGYGAVICAVENPGLFAAVAPVCGGVIPPVQFSPQQERALSPVCRKVLGSPDPYAALAPLFGSTPVWLFHGSADDLVPVTESRNIHSALKAAGGNVRFTELDGRGHDIGGTVYDDTTFLTWFFSMKRNADGEGKR